MAAFNPRELCCFEPGIVCAFIICVLLFRGEKRSPRAELMVSRSTLFRAWLAARDHGEGYVVRVVGHGEVLAAVDHRAIHGGKDTGHLFEPSKSRRWLQSMAQSC